MYSAVMPGAALSFRALVWVPDVPPGDGRVSLALFVLDPDLKRVAAAGSGQEQKSMHSW